MRSLYKEISALFLILLVSFSCKQAPKAVHAKNNKSASKARITDSSADLVKIAKDKKSDTKRKKKRRAEDEQHIAYMPGPYPTTQPMFGTPWPAPPPVIIGPDDDGVVDDDSYYEDGRNIGIRPGDDDDFEDGDEDDDELSDGGSDDIIDGVDEGEGEPTGVGDGAYDISPGDTFCSPLDAEDSEQVWRRFLAPNEKLETYYNSFGTGFTPIFLIGLGHFVQDTHTIAISPFIPIDSLPVGTLSGVGEFESANIQAKFFNALKEAYGPLTWLQVDTPVLDTFWSKNRRVLMNQRFNIFNDQAQLIAVIRSLAQYHVPCKHGLVPLVDWITYTMEIIIPPVVK